MSFKAIKTMFSAVGVCVIVMSGFTLAGCSERRNVQYETPFDERIADYSTSSNMQSAELPLETTSGHQINRDEHQPYKEFRLDEQLLKTVEQDKLYVRVNVHINDEALRVEYEEKYPDLVEDYYSWGRFLSNSGEQLIRDFVRDFDIDYEGLDSVFKMGGEFWCELDRDTVSLMLNDPRVAEIVLGVGDRPVLQDF